MVNITGTYSYTSYVRVAMLLLVLLIVIVIVYIYYKKYFDSDINYYKNPSCNYKISETLLDVFDKYNIKPKRNNILIKSKNTKTVYLPCLYDEPVKEILALPKDKYGYYFIINTSDIMVGKDYLANELMNYYGDNYSKFIPVSYITYNQNHMADFKKKYDKYKLYIMKKNVQRQEGIKISNNKKELLESHKDGYVIIQELLQNPYLVGGRKINLRVYFLIVINNSKFNVYVYNDGFMYYTPELFKADSMDISSNITTGYIDRQVYVENPLTHRDFRKYLGDELATDIFDNIRTLIKNITIPYEQKFLQSQFMPGNIQFQLFGADVAINGDGTAMIMEVNKGPDLGAKDKRDSELKHNLVEDILNIIGIIKKNNNDFIKVL